MLWTVKQPCPATLASAQLGVAFLDTLLLMFVHCKPTHCLPVVVELHISHCYRSALSLPCLHGTFVAWYFHCMVQTVYCGVAARHTKASGHSGILESAKAVVEDLQSTGVLEGLMLHPPVPPTLLIKLA